MVVNNRIWIVGSVLIMVAVVLLGYFLGAVPRVGEIAATEVQRQGAIAQNQAYAATLASLEKDFENIDEFQSELDELQEQIPSRSGLSRFIGSLRELEVASGVVLKTFAAADPKPFVYLESLETATVPVPEATEGDAAAATPDPTVPVGPTPRLVQTLSPNEFVAIQINLEVTGTQAQIFAFVDALQNAKRRFLVTEFSFLADDTAPGLYTGKVGGSVYVLIDPNEPVGSEEEEEVAEEPAPTASPSPSGSPTPSSSPSPSGSPAP